MTQPTAGWRPLPECVGCGTPTRRSTHARLGGYCSSCKRVEHPALGRERAELAAWQSTVARIRRPERQAALDRADRLRRRREARQ